MLDKEATARIKINKLLDAAGWLFFREGDAPANIRLEPGVTIKTTDLHDACPGTWLFEVALFDGSKYSVWLAIRK